MQITTPTLKRDKARSLFFMHIAKTGGTSLSVAVRRLFDADQRFEDNGDVSVPYIESLGDRPFHGGFIYGHPRAGVATLLKERVDIITVLRNPADKAVSHYLHIRKTPASHLFDDACRLSLTEFFRLHAYLIANQTLSIATTLDGRPPYEVDDAESRAAEVSAFLESITYVGVLERSAETCEFITRFLDSEHPVHLPRVNTARSRGDTQDIFERLKAEYMAMKDSGELSTFFDIEQKLYDRAVALMEQRLNHYGIVGPADEAPVERPEALRIPAREFFCPDGELVDGRYVCSLAGSGANPVFGPYDHLDLGDYEIEFHFRLRDADPGASATMELDVVANGSHVLSSRLIRNAASPFARPHTLFFRNEEPSDVLEFRIGRLDCMSGVLEFDGVSVRPVRNSIWFLRVLRTVLAGAGPGQGGLERHAQP